MKKIAFINQRYGLEINGGSEYYTRQIAEHLANEYDVHVITTCALDYITWKNYYPAGESIINGVTVHRFKVTHPRDHKFGEITQKLLENPKSIELQNEWIDKQGPLSHDAIKYIIENKNNYDIFIFVTYLYYLTARGLKHVKDKAILIPTAHDEPYIYFDIYKEVFTKPKAIIYLTSEEAKFVKNLFNNQDIPNDEIGIGIELPKKISSKHFKNKYNINTPYILYTGRIEQSKGCDQLFKYFLEYKKRNVNDVKLILMGKPIMTIPNHKDIISLGFVSEEDKYNGLSGASALILPSKFESLSISVLEALASKIPVIVNEKCEVLKGHCLKSNAGLYYNNFLEFEEILNYILTNKEISIIMGQNGKKYIDNNYKWDTVINKFRKILDKIN